MRSRSSPLAVAAAALIACALPRPAAADAQADAAMKDVATATKAVQSLTADVTMSIEMAGRGQKLSVDGSVQLKRPNLALIKLGAPFSATVACDGKTLYNVSATGYTKATADPQGKNIDAMVAIPVNMFFDQNNLGFTKLADSKTQLLPPVTLDGQSYRVVSATGTKPATYTMKLFISPDNVVTRVAVQISAGGQEEHLTADLKNVKLNQQLSDTVFAYTPPANIQQASAQSDDYSSKLVGVGKDAPNFTIPTPTGGQVSLTEATRGNKAVIVNFWFYG